MRINQQETSQSLDKFIRIPESYHEFRKSEILILNGFFGCESREELIRASQRMAWLLDDANIEPKERHYFLKLCLHLADLVFTDFKSLESPLRGRYRNYKGAGRPWKILFTEEMAQHVRELCNQGKTRREAISILKHQKVLPDAAESSLIKRFQEHEKRQRQLREDFAELDLTEYRRDL